ncbi:MAG TPA: bifunctional phosphoribosylaminoimidazolecarboxamide formyltransferase/IMP cyclohydrolase [Chloroflexota bacterium]|nr:bifunctional phosphoribosylaminoimidazolecarboxamide formyltransferase/IMP cyclohydrolase [Chloroflexota bacterium]
MRAIISVWDKQGVVDFSRALGELGVEIISTGGTQAALSSAGVPVKAVTDLTGFPEILEGRVKTLHPLIHGGILARRDNPDDRSVMEEHGIEPIDLVIVNLYPFEQTIERADTGLAEALANIDVGGPTLIRAAAKNFKDVIVVVDPGDYGMVLDSLRNGNTLDDGARRHLAAKAFQHTAVYDTHVAGYLRPDDEPLPDEITLAMRKVDDLRYGENPHQAAAFYVHTPSPQRGATLAGGRQLHGKQLSFNNLLDIDAALQAVRTFAAPTVAIVKHGNPCGLSCADSLLDAYQHAHAGDPISAFGGAVGLNREVDAGTATEIAQTFYEDIVAPSFTDDALKILTKKRDLRLFQVDFRPFDPQTLRVAPTLAMDVRRVSGGFLVQTPDDVPEDAITLKKVSDREPTLDELTDMMFAWRVVKFVKSNAIVLASRLSIVGVGAGQMSRVDAVDLAVRKAGGRAVGSVLASDAFFPKPDGVELAAEAGVTAIIQPGGSIRDSEIIRSVNKHHMAMVTTGFRHFRH